MKPKMKCFIPFVLALVMVLALATTASAASTGETGPSTVDEATIHMDRTGSITIYKYDTTQAEKDGVWDPDNYKSTGEYDEDVNNVLGAAATAVGSVSNSIGNGQSENSYAVKGVVFEYLKVADFKQYSEVQSDGSTDVILLYGFNKNDDILSILELGEADSYTDANEGNTWYFVSDTLNDALETIMQSGTRTSKKDALENYITSHGGIAFAETDADGYTHVEGLSLGLYLIVETSVPEDVVSTTNPFFVSLPMTAVTGGFWDSATQSWTRNADGGNRWVYDVTLYPKNETGVPTLEKTEREYIDDTGKNNGSDIITDGYEHNATASGGDIVEFQIISTLPTITSEATWISEYTFVDIIQYGLKYNEDDGVTIEIFTDTECTDRVASWHGSSNKADVSDYFTVSYGIVPGSGYPTQDTMTITMTDAGLKEINTSTAGPQGATTVGFSDYTMRITYTCTVDSSSAVIYGDAGNINEVTLEWSRSGQDYYDQLVDDCHFYTYAIDLTKEFTSGTGDFSKVEFILHNDTDDYYVQARYDAEDEVYYVIGHTPDEDAATHFTPTGDGKLEIFGIEDDEYTMTEVRTSDGYALLKDDIHIVISVELTDELCSIYDAAGNVVFQGQDLRDILGLIQNDVRWVDSDYSAMKTLYHYMLTSSATVDGNAVTMESQDGSPNAKVPLTVYNTRTFGLPATGGNGTWIMPCIGVALALIGVTVLVAVLRRKDGEDEDNTPAA